MTISISRESPLLPDIAGLMVRHSAAMHAESPPESIHMLDPAALAAPDIMFFTMRENGVPVGMGALKRLDAGHGEIKSMHVLSEMRGRGLARAMLDHLMSEARAAGFVRLSLETGSQPAFQPARGLYAGKGFRECPPFANYRLDPHSVFMTCLLGEV